MSPLVQLQTRWPEGSLGHESELLRRRFAGSGIENAGSDARALLCWALNCDGAHLAAHAGDPLPHDAAAILTGAARRREGREPLAYITGEREFWSIPIKTAPGGLIPRPETELLVERCAAALSGAKAPRILDLCTGTGAVGVALAKELPGARILASDISAEALELAETNAALAGVEGRFEAVRSDLFESLPEGALFDAIVSNPPYIESGLFDGLMPEVALHEPREALDGGPDGLRYLRRILREAPERLKAGGFLLMEMDPSQISWCAAELSLSPDFSKAKVHRDLAGRERAIEAEAL